MVGGKVIEVAPHTLGSGKKVIRLWCMDPRHPSDECAVFTEVAKELPQPGDQIWWQGGQIFWTPQDERFIERPIPKIAFSFDPRKTA